MRLYSEEGILMCQGQGIQLEMEDPPSCTLEQWRHCSSREQLPCLPGQSSWGLEFIACLEWGVEKDKVE